MVMWELLMEDDVEMVEEVSYGWSVIVWFVLTQLMIIFILNHYLFWLSKGLSRLRHAIHEILPHLTTKPSKITNTRNSANRPRLNTSTPRLVDRHERSLEIQPHLHQGMYHRHGVWLRPRRFADGGCDWHGDHLWKCLEGWWWTRYALCGGYWCCWV
jgi:hypothetical protein